MADDEIKEAFKAMSPEVKTTAAAMSAKQTQDDFDLANLIVNMAIDVTKGNKEAAVEYLTFVKTQSPGLCRLFARIGWEIVEGEIARKH